MPSEPDAQRVSELYDKFWEGQGDVDDEVFLQVLDVAVEAAEGRGISYVLMGGIASAALGRPRWTHDIDFFVRPQDARPLLEALSERGFAIAETNPHWLYKAAKDGVLVDLIFRSVGDLYLDDDIVARSVVRDFAGRKLRVISCEDLLHIKAMANAEHTPRHWYDSLALLASGDVDWDYLLERARHRGGRRVLSLLIYAQSNDIVVPERVVRDLYEAVYGTRP